MAEITLHFLLVEDDPSHAEMIRRAFAAYSRPVRLTVVETIQQAKEHLGKCATDLVITDLILPDGKGTEILPAPPNSLSYPVIIMTSYGNEQAAVESMKAGALDYVVKSESILRDMPHITERALRQWQQKLELERMQQSLAQERHLLRTLVDALPDKIYVKDKRSRFQFCNRECAAALRAESPAHILGKTDFDFYPEDLAQTFFQEEQEIIRTGLSILASERSYQDDEGHTHWVSVTKVPWRDREGNILGIVGLSRDITETKLTVDALKESEEKFRYLAEQSPNMIFINCRGRVVYANNRCEELIGYTREEFYAPAFDFLTLIAPESLDVVRRNFQRHMTGEDIRPYEYALLARDGKRIDVIISSKLITYERDTAILGIVTDISELKQAEQALRESEAQLKSIFDNTTFGIYRTTPDGKILMANPALVQMLGYASFEELAQRNLETEGYDADYPRARFREKIEREGRITALDSAWKRRDGSFFYARENAIAVRDEYGNIRYYEGTIENITEQKRAEEKILEYQKQLQSLASQLSFTEERERRQLATALHDNIGQLLAISKIKQGSLVDKSLPENRNTLEEIRTLTEQAIQYTRTLTFELSPPILYELGLGAAVEWLVDHTRQQHHIDIRFQTDNSNPPLEDDMRVLLFQAVRELLVNVAKHSQATKVKVALQRENHKVCIVVEDNGIGMESDQISTIGQNTAGFGLFNIRERLDHLGGKMNITSKSGKGTKITLVAPLKIE